MKRLLFVQASPGQSVHDFADQMLEIADALDYAVHGTFNQYHLTAARGMFREQVIKPWDDAQRRSYLNAS